MLRVIVHALYAVPRSVALQRCSSLKEAHFYAGSAIFVVLQWRNHVDVSVYSAINVVCVHSPKIRDLAIRFTNTCVLPYLTFNMDYILGSQTETTKVLMKYL